MIVQEHVSAQQISWVKSNKTRLESHNGIERLYYPESLLEMKELIINLQSDQASFTLIGYSSNTLFLPSFTAKNVICTTHVCQWEETGDAIICDCGVSVSKLAKYAVGKGYVGFEGLTDLPGTIAAAVYGNCGCRGCSINELVRSFTILLKDGSIKELTIRDLKTAYRSTALKRGDLEGTILQVILNKHKGDAIELKRIAEQNHSIRKSQQPSAANNLGTTFNGGSQKTILGKLLKLLERLIRIIPKHKNPRKSFPLMLKIIGKGKYSPYVYYWNRFIFLDSYSHELFFGYCQLLKRMYKDIRLEIEIKK